MFLRNRQGFTLVELLVVIMIIGVLVGLLVPAVQAARERGRQAACMNNQKELALAAVQYDGAKQHYPGYLNPTMAKLPNNWATVLFPYLGREDLWGQWRNGRTPTTPVVRLEQFVCPDDRQSGEAPLSYVANCGMPDAKNPDYEKFTLCQPDPEAKLANVGPLGNGKIAPDLARNGLFFNRAIKASPMTGPVVSVTASDIVDGASQTLMIAEHTRSTPSSWDALGEAVSGFTWLAAPDLATLERLQITDKTVNPAAVGSGHPRGLIVAFADQHTQFLNDMVSYRVYQLLMTPNSAEAYEVNRPGWPSANAAGWNVAGTLNQGDYQ